MDFGPFEPAGGLPRDEVRQRVGWRGSVDKIGAASRPGDGEPEGDAPDPPPAS